MAVINTGSVIEDFVDNVVAVLDTKKTDWGIVDIYDADVQLLNDLPIITVNFTQGQFNILDPKRGRPILNADIWYYYAEYHEIKNKNQIDKRVWDIVNLMLTNQTVNGFCFKNEIVDFGTYIRRKNRIYGAGKVSIRGYVNAQAVDCI